MQFNRRCVVLALPWKLLFYARGLHSVFVGLVTQLCSPSNVCVECRHKLCAYIKLTFHLHHARHSCSVFTAVWCGCFVRILTFYLHQTPSWLWLVWTNSPVFTPPGNRQVGTTVQTMPGLHRNEHASSPRITRPYHIQGIDHIKMVDHHDVI